MVGLGALGGLWKSGILAFIGFGKEFGGANLGMWLILALVGSTFGICVLVTSAISSLVLGDGKIDLDPVRGASARLTVITSAQSIAHCSDRHRDTFGWRNGRHPDRCVPFAWLISILKSQAMGLELFHSDLSLTRKNSSGLAYRHHHVARLECPRGLCICPDGTQRRHVKTPRSPWKYTMSELAHANCGSP